MAHLITMIWRTQKQWEHNSNIKTKKKAWWTVKSNLNIYE